MRGVSLPDDCRGRNDEQTVVASRVGLRADEQPADSGCAPAAESRPVDDFSFDVPVQPPGGQSDDGDDDVASVVRIASLTAPRQPFRLRRVHALLSWPARVTIDGGARTEICHADNG